MQVGVHIPYDYAKLEKQKIHGLMICFENIADLKPADVRNLMHTLSHFFNCLTQLLFFPFMCRRMNIFLLLCKVE